MAISNRALSELIGSIYDCTIDPSRWEETLAEIVLFLHCDRAMLSLNDLRRDRILIDKHVGCEPEWLEERLKHLPEIHGKLSKWFASGPTVDQPFVASRELSATDAQLSPYVRNCLQPLGLLDVAHFFLIRTPASFSELVLWRGEAEGPLSDEDIGLGALLMPHLRRAVTISNVLEVRTVERDRMAEALDALRHGVLLLDERGAILHANRSAEFMLSGNSPIRISGGILAARSDPANGELRKAIMLAARDEAAIGRTGVAIRLTEEALPPVFAHVLPLAGGELRSRLRPRAVAAVFVDATPDEQDRAALLAVAFGLTPAETRVVASLLGGRTLSETASALDIAFTTVKTHLARIFLKTGVSRQAELVRLAMQTASPQSGHQAEQRWN